MDRFVQDSGNQVFIGGVKCEGGKSHRNPMRHEPGQRGELPQGEVGRFLGWTATVTHGELGGREEERKQLG